MQCVLPLIINSDQTGFIKKRYIGSNLRTVQDIIEAAREGEEQAFLLALNYKKNRNLRSELRFHVTILYTSKWCEAGVLCPSSFFCYFCRVTGSND